MAASAGLAAANSASAPPAGSNDAVAYSTLEDWIEREAMPFSLDALEDFNAAVDKVVASLGDQVELLGFGETMHGSEEILQVRNRFFQRLVEAHGYRAIALESGFPESRHVNEYVLGGSGAQAQAAARGIGWGFGRLEANHELIEWMRRYNADPAHAVKLHFYGFDISASGNARVAGPQEVLHLALDYLASLDNESARAHRQRIDALLSKLSGWDNADVWIGRAKAPGLTSAATQLRIETEDLITQLRTRRPELIARSDADRYRSALRYAEVARETLKFHAALARSSAEPVAGLRGVRDALMADNLAYIVERERGRGKVLAYAGQGHLRRGKARWPCCGQRYLGTDVYEWWPAGSHINEVFGPRFAMIGTALGVSEQNGVGQPEPGTLEARLMAFPAAAMFIPTHRGKGLPAAEIAAAPMRSGSSRNLTYSGMVPQSFTDFDWLVFLDSSTYNRGGPALESWDTARRNEKSSNSAGEEQQ